MSDAFPHRKCNNRATVCRHTFRAPKTLAACGVKSMPSFFQKRPFLFRVSSGLATLRVVFALDSRRANCPAAIRSQDTFLRVLRGIVLCIFVNVTSTEGKVCWLLLWQTL